MRDITQQNVEKEQLAQLLASDLSSRVSNFILALIFAYVISDVLAKEIVIIWLFSLFFINTMRFLITRHFIKNPSELAEVIHNRLNVYRLLIYLNAIAWGACSLMLYDQGHFEYQLFLAFMLTGLSAGAAFVFSIDIISALAYLLFAIVPLLLSFILSNNEMLNIMTLAGALYVVFMFNALLGFNVRIIEVISLRIKAQKNSEEIKQLAFFDVLTGLPNRRLLLERLERTLTSNVRTEKFSALFFIDLDKFKYLNDTLGHDYGDELLVQVSSRLKECIRSSDTVSRFGGDEFVIILENLNNNYDDALRESNNVASIILDHLNRPYHLKGSEYFSTPSIGITILDNEEKSLSVLLKQADIAMYHAKSQGRNRICVYDKTIMS